MTALRTDLDRLLGVYEALPEPARDRVVAGLESLCQGRPADLADTVRLLSSFGKLSREVQGRVVDAVEALSVGDLAVYGNSILKAAAQVELEREAAGLRLRPADWRRGRGG